MYTIRIFLFYMTVSIDITKAIQAENNETVFVLKGWNITLTGPLDLDIIQWSIPGYTNLFDVSNGIVNGNYLDILPGKAGKSIRVLNVEINRTYRCSGFDAARNPKTKDFHVQVFDMTFNFGKQQLIDNERITADCHINASNSPDSIKLIVNNKTIKAVNRSSRLSHSVIIRKENHRQWASCTVQYSRYRYWKAAQLTVHWIPKIELKISPGSEIKLGETAYFTCNIDGNPPVTSAHLITPNNSTQVMTMSSVNQYEFTLIDVSKEDIGGYTCEATNSIGTGRTYTILTINDADGLNGSTIILVTCTTITVVFVTVLVLARFLIRRNRNNVQMEDSDEPGPTGQAVYNIYDEVGQMNNAQNHREQDENTDHNADSDDIGQGEASGIETAQEHPGLHYIELDFSSQQQRLNNTNRNHNDDRTEYSEIMFS